jgi:hypothetical protein
MSDAQIVFALAFFVACTFSVDRALRVYRSPQGTFVAFWGWTLTGAFNGLLAAALVLA